MNHRAKYNVLQADVSRILFDLDKTVLDYDPDHVSGADVVVMAEIKKYLMALNELTWYMHNEEDEG